MIASAIDRAFVDKLIADGRGGKPIDPEKFASMMVYDLFELEQRAQVPTGTAKNEPQAPQLQAYMLRSLRVIDSLLNMELSLEQALFWFRCAMVTEFGNKSPQALVAKDCADEVISCLRNVFVTQRDTLAPLWEQMREDTLSVQADIFRDVKLLTVYEVAAILGLNGGGKTRMNMARALAKDGTMFFITKDGEPAFPAYQFEPTGAKPIIARVLAILRPRRSSWEITAWFWGSNGWLDGDTPEDLLDSEPDLVLDAAFQEVAEEVE
jgi:hypothetical protein